jgi:tRNA U38,U39,U40 pseudouridine synthase TruA
MRIGILTANLGDFDSDVDFVNQRLPEGIEVIFHRWTDKNFPPMTVAMSPRFQYRIPKMFGWQMFPDCDVYIWLDGSMSFQRSDCVKWYLEQLGGNDIAFFKHPWRKTIEEETNHVEEKLRENNYYITPRYENGLHKEQLAECMADPDFEDNILYASTTFIYRNNKKVQKAMKDWWYHTSRYFTVDQIALPYVLWKNGVKVKTIDENVFDFKYLTFNKH